MRVFASLPVPPWLAGSLTPALPNMPGGVRAVPPERWHLTLAFYGEMDDAGVDCLGRKLRRRLAAMAPAAALRLRVSGGGVFAGGVAFLAVTEVDREPVRGNERRLLGLARECIRAGRGCDAPGVGDRERFRAHITIARARRRAAVARDYRDRLRQVGSPDWEAREVLLVASFLGAQPRYEVLQSVSFTQ